MTVQLADLLQEALIKFRNDTFELKLGFLLFHPHIRACRSVPAMLIYHPVKSRYNDVYLFSSMTTVTISNGIRPAFTNTKTVVISQSSDCNPIIILQVRPNAVFYSGVGGEHHPLLYVFSCQDRTAGHLTCCFGRHLRNFYDNFTPYDFCFRFFRW